MLSRFWAYPCHMDLVLVGRPRNDGSRGCVTEKWRREGQRGFTEEVVSAQL